MKVEKLTENDFQVREVFDSGHSNALVARIVQGQEVRVLKQARDARSQCEIQKNLEGYHKIREEGVDEILPEIYEEGAVEGYRYMLMEDLGINFAEQVHTTENPVQLYVQLTDRLFPIYQKTLRNDNSTLDFLTNVRSRIMVNLGLLKCTPEFRESVEKTSVDQLVTQRSCFAVFDFTPEDVFLSGETIKYPDPKHEVRGNPIIDLACFAGVARDVMHLPGSGEGYGVLHDFALSEVAELLGISVLQAEKTFLFGRMLQSSLSARVRIGKNDHLASCYKDKTWQYFSKMQEVLHV